MCFVVKSLVFAKKTFKYFLFYSKYITLSANDKKGEKGVKYVQT